MTNVRTVNRSNTTSAKPPSPIPTAKGLKSSAINDEILSEYIQKTVHVPDLSLPESYFPVKDHRSIPAEIDLPSLLSGDGDSVRQFLESVTEFGVFRLIGHGISDDDLQSIIAEIELVLGLGVSNVKRERRDRRLKRASREEFFWFRSGKGSSEPLCDEIGSERYRFFRKKMDEIYGRLEAIAGSVGQILLNYMKEPQEKGIRMREPVLCCYRYSPEHDNIERDEQAKKNVHTFDHALSLYVSIGNQEFHVKTGKGPISFDTCSGSIVGTIRRLEEWSQGEFKRVQSEPMLKRDVDESPSYSIEFMFTPSSLNYSPTTSQRDDTKLMIISLFDQLMVALAIAFLYNFLTYIL